MSVVGAVDIGSTSVKVLVRSGDDELDRATVVTRLGRGVDTDRRLDPAAIEATLGALRDFRAAGDRLGVEAWRAVATSACRDAANRDEFLTAVEDVLGVRPDVLSGEDEGRWSFRGAVGVLGAAHPRPALVVDIGGGSTELILGNEEAEVVRSIDVGAGRLLERELHSDPPRPEELTNAIGLVQDHLDDVLREVPEARDAATLVGVGGTVKVAAAIELGLASYVPSAVHGFVFEREAVEDVFRTLATERLADRVHNPGLPADRAEVIVGGCCVLVGIMRRLHAEAIVVSARGVVDALADDLVRGLR